MPLTVNVSEAVWAPFMALLAANEAAQRAQSWSNVGVNRGAF